jgi:hypothetical protein
MSDATLRVAGRDGVTIVEDFEPEASNCVHVDAEVPQRPTGLARRDCTKAFGSVGRGRATARRTAKQGRHLAVM